MSITPNVRDLVLLAAGASTVMAGAAIAPILVPLHEALSADGADVWRVRVALILPALVVAMTAPFLGWLLDRVPQERVLGFGLIVVGAAGIAGAFTSNYDEFMLTRAALGIATACTAIAATALIAKHHQGEARARMMSRQTAVNTLGGVVFLVVGCVLGELGWQPPFVAFVLPLAVAYLAMKMRDTDPIPKDRSRFKVPASVGLIVVAMAAFYLVPTRIPHILAELGLSTAATGLVIGLATFSGAASALSAQRLAKRLNETTVLQIAAGLGVLGLYLFAATASTGTTLAAAVLLGAAFGMVPPIIAGRVFSWTPPEARGSAAGWISAALFAGQVVSVALAEPIAYLLGDRAPFAIFAVAIALAAANYSFLTSHGATKHGQTSH